MSKLVITDTNGAVTERELDRERITIGRQTGNDVVLNDKAVSGRHAAIVTILEDSFLEDLESTNGTQVNGQPITKHPLAHGDVITLGRNSVRYLNEEESGSENDKTMVIRPGGMAAAMRGAPPVGARAPAMGTLGAASVAAGGKPLLGKLRVSSGPNQGRELELSKPLTTIGKPGVQVAAITRRADGYYIVQVGEGASIQRIMVNGVEIDAQTRRLAHNDDIELAGTKMQFLVIS